MSATDRTGTSMKCWWTMLMPRSIASDGPWIVATPPVEQDLALVRRRQPVQDVHQRRLAGAVLAQQRVDLAGTDLEVDPVVGHDARIALRDAAHLQRGGGHGLGNGHGGLRLLGDGDEPIKSGMARIINGRKTIEAVLATASVSAGCERVLGAGDGALDGRARVERPVDEAARTRRRSSVWISGVISAALSWYGARPMAAGSTPRCRGRCRPRTCRSRRSG